MPEPLTSVPRTDPEAISLDGQIKAAERELAMRQRIYPGWVNAKRMTVHKASEEIAAMAAILKTLKGIQR